MTKWAFLLAASLVLAQRTPQETPDGTWLDTRAAWKWSEAELRRGERERGNTRCEALTRPPATPAERILSQAEWMLTGSASITNRKTGIEIAYGFRQFDGMCRDLQGQGFVFVNGRAIGTLSPRLTYARSDGHLGEVTVSDSGEVRATFRRYSPKDPLCCPSRESVAFYSVAREGSTYVLKLLRVETKSLSVTR
jgi:hypothetical protein